MSEMNWTRACFLVSLLHFHFSVGFRFCVGDSLSCHLQQGYRSRDCSIPSGELCTPWLKNKLSLEAFEKTIQHLAGTVSLPPSVDLKFTVHTQQEVLLLGIATKPLKVAFPTLIVTSNSRRDLSLPRINCFKMRTGRWKTLRITFSVRHTRINHAEYRNGTDGENKSWPSQASTLSLLLHFSCEDEPSSKENDTRLPLGDQVLWFVPGTVDGAVVSLPTNTANIDSSEKSSFLKEIVTVCTVVLLLLLVSFALLVHAYLRSLNKKANSAGQVVSVRWRAQDRHGIPRSQVLEAQLTLTRASRLWRRAVDGNTYERYSMPTPLRAVGERARSTGQPPDASTRVFEHYV